MYLNRWRLFSLLGLLLLLPYTAAVKAHHSDRQRISINDKWKFSRFEETPDGLSYDHRPALPDTSGTKILKPWVLPSANDFINDSENHYPQPRGDPPQNIPFVRQGFDDSDWEDVDLPHDWAIKGPFYVGQDVPVGGSQGRLPSQGVGWYRRKLSKLPQDREKSVYLDIEGAMSYAIVWLNGKLVGGWPFGYNSFRLDLTPYLKPGNDNQLAIRLENPTNSSRWYSGAGLYRNVWLTKVDHTHVAQYGTFITSRDVSTKSATLDVSVNVEHKSTSSREIKVATDIYEVSHSTGQLGRRVSSFSRSAIRLPPGSTKELKWAVEIKNPKLWGPYTKQKPHLYKAVTRLSSGSQVFDTYETQFGIRSLTLDPNKGLFVNDQLIKIHGVNMHHDLGALGGAWNARAAERQLRSLQELSCNAIRMGHNPPAPELLDMTDRMGFMIIDEIFDSWNTSKLSADSTLLFPDWHEADLRSFIRRDRNHPSVIAWSFGNEIPEQTVAEKSVPIAKRLHQITKQEDPTRPALQSLDAARPSAEICAVQDVISLNYQGEGLLNGPAYSYLMQGRSLPPQHPLFHKTYPDKLIWSSESAASLSTRGTYFFPVTPYDSAPLNTTDGGNFTSLQISAYELYTIYTGASPDRVFAEQDRYPYVAGEFVWSGWDYLGEPYLLDGARSSSFGIFDLAGFKKDRFYLYQSRWRPEVKMAHILPHWTWPDRVGKITPIHVFSAADEAELFLNGRSLGRKKKAPSEYRFRWDEVKYQPGQLNVVTYNKGREWARDTVRTAGQASTLEMVADRATFKGDGKDLVFITSKILDKHGNLVPQADTLVKFSISGPGKIVATDNGYPGDFTPFPSDERRAFSGQLLAIVRAEPGMAGKITVTARAEGLKDTKVVVTAI
ncbi:hypothetical protein LCI18_014209 [Fusarium solani-melongenae]|uniref:Uncharacterized protein n=1 Tax=Fusarium solani subsp. cucurbitae TaxID=2747967 RepID=A0ACD3ZPM9_FUSSC|nr:hypothetical protein LCI18_014209 [Fusarium solani-melongenae]